MNNEAEAADLILRIVIDGTAYFFKLAGTLTKPVQELVVRALRRAWYEKGPGTVNPDMKALVQRGEGLNVFQIPEKDEETFRKAVAATGMGIKYVTVPSAEPLDAKDRMTMIICSSGDATVINGVLVQNRIHGRDVAKASKENPAPIEKPETPVEKVQQETPAVEGTTEKAQEQDEAFKAYYNVGKEQPDHAQEEPENPTQAVRSVDGSPFVRKLQTIALDSSFDIRNSSRKVKVDPPASAANESPAEQPTAVEKAVVTEILDVDTKREPGQWPDERHADFLRRQAAKEKEKYGDPSRIIDVEPEELKPVVPSESKGHEQSEPRSDGRFSIKERIRKIRNDMAQETKAPVAEAPAKSAVQESVENQLKEKIAGETRG